ncbi:MAG TPA: transporter substrate-binding domain-containing protein [Gaiellaceae bacterium]|nr:transporter substrate-binding domain-containing protein [Gaiellaceae bacterium]
MKKLLATCVVLLLGAAAVSAWGFAATTKEGVTHAAAATKLPPLPPEIKAHKRWSIGVKCDSPPFGYINVKGEHAGFDVEIARWFSRYAFGKPNRVSFLCTPTAAREPSLTSGRVDLEIATFTYTQDRDTRIDFSIPYYKATGRLLVPNSSPIHSTADLAGKTVVTTRGSIYDRWVSKCFPSTKLTVTDTVTNSLLTLNQGRADAFMFDDTVVLGFAVTDPTLKLTDDGFLQAPYGIGIKQGNVAMKKWVDSRLKLMQKKDQFNVILKANVPNRVFASFQKNVLRPGQSFQYNQVDPSTVCP